MKLKQKLLAQDELEALTTRINFRARGLGNEVNDLLDKETMMWFQRSRALWAIHGDKIQNTSIVGPLKHIGEIRLKE